MEFIWTTCEVLDSDNDGVTDGQDECNGFDDNIDTDGDGVADGCDQDWDNDGILNVNEGLSPPTETKLWIAFNPYTTIESNLTVTTTIHFSGNANQYKSNGSFGPTNFWSKDLIFNNSLELGLIWDMTPDFQGADIDQPFDDKGFGTITFNFSKQVNNPILHIDRLGGSGGAFEGSVSNSVKFELTTPNVTLTKLKGTGDFDVTPTTIQRTPNLLTTPNPEAGSEITNGTAAGSIIINGSFNSISFNWTGVGVEGIGHDEIEIIWSLQDQQDTDGDQVYDFLDLDSDNDGISDLIESGQNHTVVDVANNGIHDGGVDGNGVPTASGGGVTLVDSDGDGLDNNLDLDSDADGIPDNIEAQPTTGYSTPAYVNNATNNGLNDNGLFVPENTDGTDYPDYLDPDSDNDTKLDTAESGLTLTGLDVNKDGWDDGVNGSYANVNGDVNDPAIDLDNEFGDNKEVAFREIKGLILNITSPHCKSSGPSNFKAIPGGGTWSGSGISGGGIFEPSLAGEGTHWIHYSLGDSLIDSASIIVYPDPTFTTTEVNEICTNSNGTISVTPTGGTDPFDYNINGEPYQASNVFGNLTSGSYSIGIRDANSCTSTKNKIITNTAGPAITGTTNINPTCSNSNGSITVNSIGGTAPIEFNINGGAYQASNKFNALAAGTYVMGVRDANFCVTSINVTMNDLGAPTISGTTKVDPTCGKNNGSITINATGGTMPIEFNINGSNYQLSNEFSELAAGTYVLGVRDANLCITSQNITIKDVGGPTIKATTKVDPHCGNNNGSIIVTAIGGVSPIEYNINGGAYQSSNAFNDLAPGTITIGIRDVNLCTTTKTVELIPIYNLKIDSVKTISESCLSNGSITVSVSNGKPPYSFSINGGSTFKDSNYFPSIKRGNYNLIVMDSNNCAVSQSITINYEEISLDTSVSLSSNILTANLNDANYRWLDCNNSFKEIAEGNNQSLVVTNEGNYAVEISKANCIDTSGCYSILISNVSIPRKSSIKMFPNPTKGKISISINGNLQNPNIQITNLFGQVILKEKITSGNNIQLEFKGKPGMYFILLFDNQLLVGKEIIVKQ